MRLKVHVEEGACHAAYDTSARCVWIGSSVACSAIPNLFFSHKGICKELNLKPLHCVRGTAVNVFGEPLSGATVTIFIGGTARAAVKTGANGRFFFGDLTPGNYELRVEEDGFRTFHFPIVW